MSDMAKNALTSITMKLLPNFARDTWVNLVAKVRYEPNGDVSVCQAIMYFETPDQVEEEALAYLERIPKDGRMYPQQLISRMASQLVALRGQLLIMQQSQNARAETSETKSEVTGTEQQVEIADNELPGMWSSSDFTGGDPNERCHSERQQVARTGPKWDAIDAQIKAIAPDDFYVVRASEWDSLQAARVDKRMVERAVEAWNAAPALGREEDDANAMRAALEAALSAQPAPGSSPE